MSKKLQNRSLPLVPVRTASEPPKCADGRRPVRTSPLTAKDQAAVRYAQSLSAGTRRGSTTARRYEELADRGVEFTETPEGRPYGIDAAFRDPSGSISEASLGPSRARVAGEFGVER